MIKQMTFIIIAFTAMFLMVSCSAETNNGQQGGNETVINPESSEIEGNMYPTDEILQKGDKGKSVRLLQELFIEMGYPIEATELFDINTTWAVTDIQLQDGDSYITGIYENETKEIITAALGGKMNIKPGAGLPQPKDDQKGKSTKTVENPYEVLSLVNKQHALPADYIPNDLVIPDIRFPFTEDLPKKKLRKVAADALEEMFKEADEAGLDLFAQSGYRSYERQDVIFASNVSQHGEKAANNFSARPGESEHQTGLTMDVTSPEVKYDLTIEFGETEEGKWIQKHASEFGFIIRYPKGKEAITEYQYEPWHLRYVGEKAAKEIMEQELTLEEYLGIE